MRLHERALFVMNFEFTPIRPIEHRLQTAHRGLLRQGLRRRGVLWPLVVALLSVAHASEAQAPDSDSGSAAGELLRRLDALDKSADGQSVWRRLG